MWEHAGFVLSNSTDTRNIVSCQNNNPTLPQSRLGGPILKSAKKSLLQMPFLEFYHVYISYYDLTCSIWLKKSTHSHSYKAHRCFTVFFTSDWLVTHSSPLMIKPQWCQIPLQSVALCQNACHILLLSHLKCSYKQSVAYKSIIPLNTPARGQILKNWGMGEPEWWCGVMVNAARGFRL